MIKKFLGILVRPFVNPIVKFPTYVGVKQIKDTTKALGGMLKPIFTPPRPTEATGETFEEALQRLNLTEQDLKKRQREFTRLLLVYLSSAVSLFCYAIYLIWHHSSIHGALAAFAMTCVALAQVFRYHFWLFQIKQRKLGCTFRDWWNSDFISGN